MCSSDLPMQISAYYVAKFNRLPEVGANAYISTTEKGRAEIVWYNAEQLQKAWQAFTCATQLWQYLRGYKPPTA